ncbi:carotenoid oxygenase family protein [Pararhodobacter oceanensis]|uniref:carotenoid oxygenase family protein n=1 Tax=Pararhodobacter oceanensis TaxID=2172121 RepID=UPI003A923C49
MSLTHTPEPQDWLIENPNLVGAWGPVHTETVAQDLEVIGELPADLNGMYVRNGPSPAHAPHGRYHWFDGDGMLHSVRFQDGHATYRNRWVQTDGLKEDMRVGDALWPGLKERLPQGALPDDAMKNTSNTDVTFHNGKLYSMWYRGGTVYTVDPISLETLGKLEQDPRLIGLQISAHSRVDEHTGEFMFFAYGNRPPYMHYGVIGPDGALKTFMPVELPGPRLPHDCAITPNYTILHDFPLINSPEALARGRYSLEFHQDWPTRFAVIPRNGSADQIRWYEFKPRYMLHVANAWEEVNDKGETELVMLGTPYVNPRGFDGGLDVQRLLFTIGTQGTDYELYQWRMNLTTGATKEGIVDDILNSEFPMINTAYQGRKNRYTYNVLMGRMRTLEQPAFAGLVKYDLDTGGAQAFHPGEGYWFSEAPFAPRDGATEEDDGYVVGFVWNGIANRSEVWVTDAKDIAKGPIAKVILPQRVPHGFHSCWVREDQLKAAQVA